MMIQEIQKNGQILLGRQYAGRKVMIEQIHEGVWIIKTGQFIPDNEKWIHQTDISASLDSAIEWAEQNPPEETDLDSLEEKLNL